MPNNPNYLPNFAFNLVNASVPLAERSASLTNTSMHDFSSKELYLANGGNKIYIYKDGFGDVYSATPEEEAEWAKEVVARALGRLDTETNSTGLTFAINDLLFHNYKGLESLLIEKMNTTTPVRQIIFATALWKSFHNVQSFDIVYNNFQEHRHECLDEAFHGLIEFKKSHPAHKFILWCLTGTDSLLQTKAHTTVSMWAYTGLPQLRSNKLLERLTPENTDPAVFAEAIEELKTILTKA
ncbi:hypothetical protein [Chryseolinea lacunae]|uniref:Uncharacterized protein n=1 Tax=Chryseolinea lacunae TaxID=2801331 RepID=A0ABS1KPR4_9BACT|nr:hypothetical protein [Chryseolinea lacunae]MBL0741468.1 hypothetical protein [Chryseolinea lacunae]